MQAMWGTSSPQHHASFAPTGAKAWCIASARGTIVAVSLTTFVHTGAPSWASAPLKRHVTVPLLPMLFWHPLLVLLEDVLLHLLLVLLEDLEPRRVACRTWDSGAPLTHEHIRMQQGLPFPFIPESPSACGVFLVPFCGLFFEAFPGTGSILFLFLFFLFFPMDGGVKVAGRPALNPRALRELLPNCWRVVAAMEKVLGSGRSNWNTNGSAVTAASGYRPSPSILNASLNTWYT